MSENALELIQGWIDKSNQKITVIPRNDTSNRCEEMLGISEHSTLGSLVNHTGGLSLANGMIRHFGGMNQFGLSIGTVNRLDNHIPKLIPGLLIIADDLFGGLFAINVNTKIGKPGTILYLPPDSYLWEDLEVGHTAFLNWAIHGDVALFFKQFESFRVPKAVSFHQTLTFEPPLWVAATNLQRYSSGTMDSSRSHLLRAEILNQL